MLLTFPSGPCLQSSSAVWAPKGGRGKKIVRRKGEEKKKKGQGEAEKLVTSFHFCSSSFRLPSLRPCGCGGGKGKGGKKGKRRRGENRGRDADSTAPSYLIHFPSLPRHGEEGKEKKGRWVNVPVFSRRCFLRLLFLFHHSGAHGKEELKEGGKKKRRKGHSMISTSPLL